MKIFGFIILFCLNIFTAIAGESDYNSNSSLVSTYYSNARNLVKTNPSQCIFWADKAITESSITGNKLDLGRSLFVKGEALEYLHQNDAAIKIYTESLKVARNYKYVDLEMDALSKLSNLYARIKDFQSAVVYASMLHDKKDSNVMMHQRLLAKSLPGKADLMRNEDRMKQLMSDNSALDNHLRTNLKLIDNQGNWILIIVVAYGLIFMSLIMIRRQNRLIIIRNQDLSDQMHSLEIGKMELEHTRYKAEESDRLKTSFLANISHEIRTPLNAIVGFSGFLRQKGKHPSERKRYIDVIHQYSESLLALINEIFEIARIESGEIKQHPATIDVNIFLHEIHAQTCLKNNELIKRGLQLTLNLEAAKLPCYLTTYPERLKNVVMHLIENALKYSETGKVEIGYVMKETFVEFWVMDDGKGFPNEQIGDIFERFKATEVFPSSSYGPLGLGLTISKNFIESMGGHIWVKSNSDKGSTFYFTLPVKLEIKD